MMLNLLKKIPTLIFLLLFFTGALCPSQFLVCLGRWRNGKCPFPSWPTPLGTSYQKFIGPWCPETQSLGVSALGGDAEEGTGYFRPPWGTGVANPWAWGNRCWLLPPTTPLPSAAPSPRPPPTALRRGSLPRAGRSVPYERHQSLTWNVCGSAGLREIRSQGS